MMVMPGTVSYTHLYHTGGANDLWLCLAHGFMMMFVSLGIKANNGKQTEHCDLQCFFRCV